jgi:hypothetical protein
MQSVGYEFVLNHCVFWELLDDLLINNLGLQDIFTYIYKEKKKKKKERKKKEEDHFEFFTE